MSASRKGAIKVLTACIETLDTGAECSEIPASVGRDIIEARRLLWTSLQALKRTK